MEARRRVLDHPAAVVATCRRCPACHCCVSRRSAGNGRVRVPRRRPHGRAVGLLLRNGFWYLVGFDHGAASSARSGSTASTGDDHGRRRRVRAACRVRPACGAARRPEVDRRRGDTTVADRARRRRHGRLRSRELGAERVVETLRDGDVEVGVPCANRRRSARGCSACSNTPRSDHPPTWRADVVAWLEAGGRLTARASWRRGAAAATAGDVAVADGAR